MSEVGFIEVIVWSLPQPLSGSTHSLKYRLADVVSGKCMLRYDNEADKRDRRHLGTIEMPHVFVPIDQRHVDFMLKAAA